MNLRNEAEQSRGRNGNGRNIVLYFRNPFYALIELYIKKKRTDLWNSVELIFGH